MTKIPFPLSSSPGASPQESAGRLINCYAEPLGKVVEAEKQTAPPAVVWRKCPGLTLFATSGAQTGFRSSIFVDSLLYTAWSGKVTKYDSTGTETVMTGVLTGTEKVFFARNNKVGTPDIVCVAPDTGAFSVLQGAPGSVISFVDTDVGAPNSVCFMDGFFIFSYGDGTLQASGLNDVTINTLDKTKAQSKPGGLNRVVTFNGQMFAMGPAFGEVYTNTANPVGFPFSRSYVLQRGLLSRYAIAGHDDGFGGALIWVADDHSVVMHNGTPHPDKISPPDLDRILRRETNDNTLEASVYIAQGHPKWVISGLTFTWEFDIGSKKWNEKQSYGQTRWRGIGGCFAFSKWIVGDTQGGRLLTVDDNSYVEYLSPLVFQIESGPVQKFPKKTKVARADFNFVTGVGDAEGPDPSGTNPQVGITWSKNLGVTWGNEIVRDLGRQATPVNVMVMRTGMTGVQGRRWRLTVSDPVYVAFMGGDQQTELLR